MDPSPRSLILDLLSTLGRSSAPVRALVSAAGLFGIRENSLRVALARLLVTEAELWILDEPFTSLDRHGIGIVEGLLDAHVAAGGMAAMTTHHRISLDHARVHRINLSA